MLHGLDTDSGINHLSCRQLRQCLCRTSKAKQRSKQRNQHRDMVAQHPPICAGPFAGSLQQRRILYMILILDTWSSSVRTTVGASSYRGHCLRLGGGDEFVPGRQSRDEFAFLNACVNQAVTTSSIARVGIPHPSFLPLRRSRCHSACRRCKGRKKGLTFRQP
jgi:hypothetical protein